MEEKLEIIEANVIRAESATTGLYAILDGLSEELGRDERYYAVLSCLSDIIRMLVIASDTLDELEIKGATEKENG